MILISHRGNIIGTSDYNAENHPAHIMNAIENGFDCEIDVRFDSNSWYLGHDRPQYKIDFEFLKNDKLWIHCKDIRSLNRLVDYNKTNENKLKFFYHNNDSYTLTSNGCIWCYRGMKLRENCICVLPEQSSYSEKELKKAFGICSDNVNSYKKYL